MVAVDVIAVGLGRLTGVSSSVAVLTVGVTVAAMIVLFERRSRRSH
jgi:hypothetical protein